MSEWPVFAAGMIAGISIGFNIAHGLWKNATDDALALARESMRQSTEFYGLMEKARRESTDRKVQP